MKKVYIKPEMEIVSFSIAENITSEINTSTPITKTTDIQKTFRTISY